MREHITDRYLNQTKYFCFSRCLFFMSVNNNYHHHLTKERKRDYSSIYERSNQMQFEQKRKKENKRLLK